MRSFLSGRWGLLAAVLIAVLVLWRRPEHSHKVLPAAVRQDSRADRPSESAAPPAPPAPPAPAAATASAAVDPYGMPPPSPDQIRPVPEPRAITAQEHQQTQQVARDLVEQGIARLTAEAQQAEKIGDVETAQRNQLRVARLRRRLAVLQQPAVATPGQP